ncbi:aldehyde ferredoxin oxidoreductase family protein [Petroclostridium sp. X23]|uniref:aldehyde ferredoxin oxidoreductase family protein n=1 Tax=Petroclostridium sp. X23 TaxID=3045146 RepID=UPI0024AE0962|nr:aldehyde ferredoxin oxidoreductase family protein [Petroclostridium sp. X23]WHH60809.1 aldehyde ferredoxin oxidoreductase family protein [Petroclostridium sp. X23]
MLKGGYMGKILRVNLTTKKITTEELPEKIAKDYIGGAGFGIKYLFDEVPGDVDPLGEENKLIFASGPLSGTSAPCASRIALTTKSPLTGAVGMALSGGYFPVEMKFAGYDILIVEGESEEPVYLWIKDDKVSIRPAKKLWGINTFDTQVLIKDELNEQNARIACIGPAGENLSKMASIINEKRAFGRKGVGAVMGSKNLKAIAIRGTGKVPIANEQAFKEARSFMLSAMKKSAHLYPQFSKLGTPMVVEVTSALGIFPSENYITTGEKNYVGDLGVEASLERAKGSEHCYGCPVGCSQMKLARGSSKYISALSDPEYETYYSFGGETGVRNLDSIIFADQLCDKLGLDTMSVGVTIGFAMELFEKGILTLEDTDGIDLKFGNHEVMVDLITEIAYRREGLGALLCDGSKAASEKIGKGSGKYAMHVKGLEFPAYDPRGAKAHGLNYATSYTGADHNRGYAFQEIFGAPFPKAYDRFAAQGKGWLTKWNQDIRCATTDCPTMCGFLMDMALPDVAQKNTADMVSSVSGLSLTPDDIAKIGERVNNLARTFNIAAGFTRADDTFPERILTEPIKGGPSKGHYISRDELKEMLDEYYNVRNWTMDGIPTREKLTELGLENAITTLEGLGLI